MKQPYLGNHIQKLRKQNGMSQQELAQKCNLNVRTVQRIENGDVSPHPFTLKTISSVLNFDMLKEEEFKTQTLEIQLTMSELSFLHKFINHQTKTILPSKFNFLFTSIITLSGLVLFSASVIITMKNLIDKTIYFVLLPGGLGGIGIILLGTLLFKYQNKIEEKIKLAELLKKILNFEKK